jgi:hypothetical protein
VGEEKVIDALTVRIRRQSHKMHFGAALNQFGTEPAFRNLDILLDD